MLPMVQAFKDAVSTDTIAAAGRRHVLPKFDGTKKKWPDWHRAVKQALEMKLFAPGGDGTLTTTTSNAAQSLALRGLIMAAIEGHAARRFDHCPESLNTV